MTSSDIPEERVFFNRRGELPGVELRTWTDSARSWCRYTAEYEFLAPITWQARVWHRRRESSLSAGWLLCAHPGDVIAAKRVLQSGALSSLSVDTTTLDAYLAAHGVALDQQRLRSVTRMSETLQHRLLAVFESLRTEADATLLQGRMLEFVEALVAEAFDKSLQPLSRQSPESRAAARIRECLQDDPAITVDLDTLSRHTGMSRFQVVRVFKRRYGLPPHSYQLQRRLVLAQKSLRDGMRPAQVAAEFGFVDQSHLTRHFKRLVGVTPAQYARVSPAPGGDRRVG
ncbi:MAG: helix-turn-helix transcriptional regulator [Myxococcota bacterium]